MTDLRKVRSLVDIMKENKDFTEISIESDEGKIIISREQQGQPVVMQQPMEQAMPQPALVPATPEVTKKTEPAEVVVEGTAVKAPCVGTYYSSSKPDSPAFVKVGDKVKEGQTVCIVEAMKNMNAIVAPCGGTIKVIHAENGQPVEFDQELLIIG